ncbi:MAG TPA: curlin [Hyphomicrobiaceae bacterium]|nr:curlin [Hyphomicrobiaceae bacterium]
MIRAKLAAGILALTVGATAIDAPTPAAAAGSVSVSIAPKGESANAIRDGLFLFSWAQQLRNSARVDQKGSGNAAAVSQSGHWNWAAIFQRGRGHSATVAQNGNSNAFGVFQFGRNTSIDAAQTGNGQAGLVLQYGW